MSDKTRIAIVVSHPIQHFCPQYVSFAENKNIDLKVFFASRLGLDKYHDVSFQKEISWGNLQIDKFNHEFLNGNAVLQSDKNIDASKLDDAIGVFKPDVVITYGYFQKLQRRAHRWAIKNKVPIAYISDSEIRHKSNWLKDLIKYPFLLNYFSSVHFFLTVGNANEAFYTKYGVPPAKMLRMHFPVDVKMYEESWANKLELRKNIRLKYGIDENEIVLSTVGKLVTWKNQDHIIRALLELEDETEKFHLFIIGSGEMLTAWKEIANQLVKNRVHFTGFINVEELPAYYAATDIYVHPASVEPHSIAISEAIYMGCPVILSDRCGSYGDSDDVQQGKNGYVYEYGNTEDLAAFIKTLSSNLDERNSFGNYSHNIAVNFQQCAHYEIVTTLSNKI